MVAPSLPVGVAVPSGDAMALPESFVVAALSQETVSACPHNIYKYPARFAPEFAREAIKAFSREGDLVIDPFCGSGTTLVEAIAAKRRIVGFDINSLACFLSRARTTPLSIHDERALEWWLNGVEKRGMTETGSRAWDSFDTEEGYYKRNLPEPITRVFSALLARIQKLGSERRRRFARWILLAVGQALLDCKKKLPSSGDVLPLFCAEFRSHLAAYRDYTWCLSRTRGFQHGSMLQQRRIINASSESIAQSGRFPKNWGAAQLVVTSPPYPGVHMLYHRWQLLGRRETPAPFLLADCRDGDGSSYYCLGSRNERGLSSYFSRTETIFGAVRMKLSAEAMIVQMVAFNDPAWQLPAYLVAMGKAGYTEVPVSGAGEHIVNGRLWRTVPGRRWYAATTSARQNASKEVVLFHRPTPA
jgi:hypothetical protein